MNSIEDEGSKTSLGGDGSKTLPDRNGGDVVSTGEEDHVPLLSRNSARIFKRFLDLPMSERDKLVGLLGGVVADAKNLYGMGRQDQRPTHDCNLSRPSLRWYSDPRYDTYPGPHRGSYETVQRSPRDMRQRGGDFNNETAANVERYREPSRQDLGEGGMGYAIRPRHYVDYIARRHHRSTFDPPVEPVYVNHFQKINTRGRSLSPQRRPKSPDGETRFLDSVISKKTLLENGYAFGIEKGEVVIDQALDRISIDNLLHQERRLRERGELPTSTNHAATKDLAESKADARRIECGNGVIQEAYNFTSNGNSDTPGIPARFPAYQREAGRHYHRQEESSRKAWGQGRDTTTLVERTSPASSNSENEETEDTSFSPRDMHGIAMPYPRYPRREVIYEEDHETIRRVPSPDEGQDSRDYLRKPVSPEIRPETDADGWLLGIQYEKRVHEENGRTSFEPATQQDLAKNISRTGTDLRDKGPGESVFQEYVVHIIREYQHSEEIKYRREGETYRNPLKTKSDYLGITVEVRSTLLIELFQKIAPYYPDQPLKEENISFAAPQRFLFHHLFHFREYVTDISGDEATKRHVKILIKCLEEIDPDDNSIIKTADKMRTKPPGNRTITFVNIWVIYKPGTIVVRHHSSNLSVRVYVVHSLSGHEKTYRDGGRVAYSTLWINCWSIAYNEAGFFTRQMSKLPLEPYQGSIDIESLDIVPLEYCVDSEKMTNMLVERGRRYWALKGRNYMEHTNGPKNNLSDNTTVRVMIDLAAYKAYEERSTTIISSSGKVMRVPMTGNDNHSMFGDASEQGRRSHVELRDETDEIDTEDPPALRHRSRKLQASINIPSANVAKPQTLYSQCSYMHEDDTPTDEQAMLCGSHVWGYSFRGKDWATYPVDKLYKVEFKKKSFDKLVMNSYYKDIVRAMVANHIQEDSNQFRDLVDGKGQGVVILLHGPPGVGKTLTAECIADLYERPLIAVTCGDIGTNPDVLEAKLEDVFRRAEEWGAVLLLDEADVFLAERNLESLERNALVSIFLRTLEYFNGILFLTSNRIGTIDEAFQSRLHVTLGLSALSVNDRKQVWHNFLAGLKHLPRDARKDLIKKSRSDWAQQPLNGRQIRNCVRTALVLARQEQVPVNQTHFERVIQLGNDYAKYLTKLKKMDMDHLAEAMGTRLKAFSKEGRMAPSRPAPDQGLGSRMMSTGRTSQAAAEDESLSESDRSFHM